MRERKERGKGEERGGERKGAALHRHPLKGWQDMIWGQCSGTRLVAILNDFVKQWCGSIFHGQQNLPLEHHHYFSKVIVNKQWQNRSRHLYNSPVLKDILLLLCSRGRGRCTETQGGPGNGKVVWLSDRYKGTCDDAPMANQAAMDCWADAKWVSKKQWEDGPFPFLLWGGPQRHGIPGNKSCSSNPKEASLKERVWRTCAQDRR